jgi:nucleoside-diphosphate kinase
MKNNFSCLAFAFICLQSIICAQESSYTQIQKNTPPFPIQKEQTLSIIKPDAVRNRHIGEIISRFEKEGLTIKALKTLNLSKEQAAQFYKEHQNRPFFNDLTQYMSSGPIVVLVLEGEQAIQKNRRLMGATDPSKAEKGSIRADFAESITQNAVHGSDSSEAAAAEILFFFHTLCKTS